MYCDEDVITLEALLKQSLSLTIPLESRNYDCDENEIKGMIDKWLDSYIVYKNVKEDIVITKDDMVIDGKKRLITLILILNRISLERNSITLQFESDTNIDDEAVKRCDVLNIKKFNKDSEQAKLKCYGEVNKIIKAYKTINNFVDSKEFTNKFYKRPGYGNLSEFKEFLQKNVEIHLEILDGYELKDFKRENWKEHETFKSDLIHLALQNRNEKFARNLSNSWLELFDFFREKFGFKEINLDIVQTKFIKFCLRMMYIAEHKGEEGYQENNLDWLGNWQIEKLSNILDWMCSNRDSIVEAYTPMCLNYSFGNFEKGMLENRVAHVTGRYWKLDDANYDGMLKQFLKNLYNDNEMVDDILIWCYISNATTVFNIQEYLRTVKILLNNNRVENNKIFYNIKKAGVKRIHPLWFKRERIIWFTKHSTYGIPNYYNYISINSELKYVSEVSKNFIEKEKHRKFIFEVVMLNDKIMRLPENDSRIGTMRYFVEKTPEDYKQIKEIVVAEMEKQSKSDYLWHIRNLENLPYFNGLVNNVLNLTDDENKPVRSNFRLTNDIKTRNKKEIEQSCAMIYKYLSMDNVNLDNFVYKDNTIMTEENKEAKYARGDVLTIPITLCDFFTDTSWKEYVKNYVIGELPKKLDEAKYKYLYIYDLLPVSWLTRWNDGFRLTFFKDQIKDSFYRDFKEISYSSLSYLALNDLIDVISEDKEVISECICKRKKYGEDEEFCDKFETL